MFFVKLKSSICCSPAFYGVSLSFSKLTCNLFNTALSTAPKIPLCRRMLGSNQRSVATLALAVRRSNHFQNFPFVRYDIPPRQNVLSGSVSLIIVVQDSSHSTLSYFKMKCGMLNLYDPSCLTEAVYLQTEPSVGPPTLPSDQIFSEPHDPYRVRNVVFEENSLLSGTPNHRVDRVLNFFSSQCSGSGSGIRCLFDPWIRNRFFPDPGSRIPKPYF
jgi:hypothetical protein